MNDDNKPAIPPGWKLVPVEPTPEMIDAYVSNHERFQSARSDWTAMLAAAPQPAIPPDHVAVPRELLERVSHSLGAFCGDEGWAQADMDTMDSVDALLAMHARGEKP